MSKKVDFSDSGVPYFGPRDRNPPDSDFGIKSEESMSSNANLTESEVSELELWQRCAFFMHPFNRGGLEFASVGQWAEFAAIMSDNSVGEIVDEHSRLVAFVERECADLKHDIERHLKINADLLAEVADLRAKLATARRDGMGWRKRQ